MGARKTTTWLLVLACAAWSVEAAAAGNNWAHEIQVYSLEQYGTLFDHRTDTNKVWKNTILVSDNQDPYYQFWNEMNCASDNCMHWASMRRRNEQVTVNSMVGSTDGWSDADLVFFYGHNTQIQPQWDNSFSHWKWFWEASGSMMFLRLGYFDMADWTDWGTPAEPYIYHRNTVDDASLANSYSVFYAYNPLTSVLIGEDFTSGTWNTENTYDQTTANAHAGKLGSEDTEWIVAHGCNALTVANYDAFGEVIASPLGVNAWKKSWDRLHAVMGHYRGTYTSMEPNLTTFAADLKAGVPIVDAYFAAHMGIGTPGPYTKATGQPAAISRKNYSCCHEFLGTWMCLLPSCADDYLEDETWTHPMADPDSDWPKLYLTRWNEAE